MEAELGLVMNPMLAELQRKKPRKESTNFLGKGIATAGMKALIFVCRVRNNFDDCNVGDSIVFLEDERYLYRIIKKELVPQAFFLRALQGEHLPTEVEKVSHLRAPTRIQKQ